MSIALHDVVIENYADEYSGGSYIGHAGLRTLKVSQLGTEPLNIEKNNT